MKNIMLSFLLGAIPLSAIPLDAYAQSSSATKALPTESTDVTDAEARAEMADLQKQLGLLSKRMAELSMTMDEHGPKMAALRYLGSPNRATVGLLLSESALGVQVGGVSPDGPAAQAGIRSGDIITRVRDRDISAGDSAKALQQAREALAGLNAGDKVEMVYRRDGKPAKTTLTATRREAINSYRLLADGADDVELDGLERNIERIVQRSSRNAMDGLDQAAIAEQAAQGATAHAYRNAGRTRVELRRSLGDMPWWGINLAELNADLGRYFGTDQGVLVLSTDGDALAGVKAGDVIQQVAGSKVSRPEDALRRLRDQPTESEVAMQVLRDRKPLTLSVHMPDNKSLFEMMPPPAPPAPPSPAAPSSPPPPPPPVAPAMRAAAVPAKSAATAVAAKFDPTATATIAAVVANPALLARVLPPRAAAKGGAVGSVGLWGGRIRSVDSNDARTCYTVAAATLDKDARPVRGDFRGTFFACTDEPLDTKQFVGGRYATFLGTITDRAGGYEGSPTLIVTDAMAWSTVPDMPRSPQPSPPPPYRG